MRALCLTAPGGRHHLALLELPSPALPGEGAVRVGIRSIALNHLDLWVADGLPGVPLPSVPHIMGCDGAGVVLECSPDVTNVRVGDRVVINPGWGCGTCDACQAGEDVFCREFGVMGEHRPGTAAEEVVVPARSVARIEGEWSWAEAAAFPLATLTAWRMLTSRAAVRPGEAVLIWGIGGGVALQALQVATHLGARVLVTSSSDSKLERARSLGAELTINHAKTDNIGSEVKRHLGHGADVIVDSVGQATWSRSLKALRPGGRLVTCGATTGHAVELDLRRLFWFQWTLLGSTMGTPREFAEIINAGNAGHLRPVVDRTMPLTEGASAYQQLADGQQFGKIVLEVTS